MHHLPPVDSLGVDRPDTLAIYIGTYTKPHGSEGIYRAVLDAKTGRLSAPTLVGKATNPSYLAMSPGGQFLYAVDESSKGAASAYAIDPAGMLRLIGTKPLLGEAPCYLSLDPGGTHLFTASYVGGAVQCLPIGADGSLGDSASVVWNSGHGPDRSRQDASHMHWIHPDPSGRFIYSCDLGTDKVQRYAFDPNTGVLEPNHRPDAQVAPGAGPRHAVWGPGNRFLYVNGEMGNTVTAFEIDQSNGDLTERQTVATLASGAPPDTGAEIALHPGGKWLYVSNRGDDSISVFRVKADGRLEREQIAPAHVRTPRGFAIAPDGKWLVVAGQDSNDITVLAIDAKAGTLHPTGAKIKVDAPVCILFAKP